MARPRPLRFLVALAAAVLARAATAEQAPAPEVEPQVEAEIVVRGAPRPQAAGALAPGAAVTVIDAARFAGEAKGAAELLGTAPGVAVTDHGGLGQSAFVSIRGASADQVKVLLDGVPLNPSAGGGVDLSSIPAQWISRIEVVRGTEGVHHGTGALGGVVNVITAPPRSGAWSAAATGGSFGTMQADAQAATGGDAWGLLGAVATSRSSGGFPYVSDGVEQTRKNDASALGGALLKAFVLGGGGRLDAAAQLSGGRRELPGMVGTVDRPTPLDWQEDARGIVSARFRRPAPGGLVLTASGSSRVDRLDLHLENLAHEVVPHQQRGVATTGSLAAEWCGAHGSLETAVEAGHEGLRGDGFGAHARETYALVAAGEISALGGRARFGPGVRLERAGAYSGTSAKVGGSVAVVGPLSLRASAGRTYRVPSFAELYLQQGIVAPNPALRPEVGLGGDGALVAEGRFGTAALGAFATVYRDLIVYELASFRLITPQNVDKSLVRGLEAELATVPFRPLAGLSGRAAYTFTDSQVLREKAEGPNPILGRELTRKPRHRLYARLGVGGAAADAHAEAQWISRQFLALGEAAEVGEALTFGAGASVRLARTAGLRLHVEVRNLLDVRTLDDSFGNPLPGRTVLVTLRAGSNTENP